MSTRRENQIHRLLLEQTSYNVQSVDPEHQRYYLENPDGERIVFSYDGFLEIFKVEGRIHFEAEYANLTSYSRIAQLAFQSDHAISWPTPYSGPDTMIKLSAKYNWTTDPDEILRILEATAGLVSLVQSYLLDLRHACDLTRVDASMFTDLSLDEIDLISLAEQKQMRYGTWDKFMTAIAASDIPAEDMEIAQRYLSACKEFEIKNPHLCLGEVARYLIQLVHDYRSKSPGRLEIN